VVVTAPVLSLLAVLGVSAAEPAASSWLDQPPAGWNRPGAVVPRAVPGDVDAETVDRCRSQVRPPAGPADRAAIAAGWTLFGPAQIFADTAVITAMTGVDGMCRPLGHQAFVFVGGRFAGTLSPVPMNSRTDGAARIIRLVGASDIQVEFVRYTREDPLCCPSGTSAVRFRIEHGERGPVVNPVDIYTSPRGP
jgi:hypothetical protein